MSDSRKPLRGAFRPLTGDIRGEELGKFPFDAFEWEEGEDGVRRLSLRSPWIFAKYSLTSEIESTYLKRIDYGTTVGTTGVATAPHFLSFNDAALRSTSSNTYSTLYTFETPAAGLWVWMVSAGVNSTTVPGRVSIRVDTTDYPSTAGYELYTPSLFRMILIELSGSSDVLVRYSRHHSSGSAVLSNISAVGYRIR